MDKGSIHFGPEIFSSQSLDDLPFVELGNLRDEVFASYSGPEDGLAYAVGSSENGTSEVAGVSHWNVKEQKAYGICISLYEQHPVNGRMSGDPLADAFAICARQNNCVMLIADGVNWGEKSRLAARSALYGSMVYINNRVFKRHRQPANTHEVFEILRASFDEAHKVIMDREGGLTTLCACLVCPVKNSSQFAMCCLNVGDSYGYVFSHNQGIREVTQGSHDVSLVRDIRDAGGALGPVDGTNPELHNMTYGLSFVNSGDIAFLTTDGISDNYDPVVTKIAVAKIDISRAETVKLESSPDGVRSDISPSSDSSGSSPTSPPGVFNSDKPEMEPKERHIYSLKEMERIVHEFELVTEEECSAQELCSALAQHVLLLTDKKRKVLENPELYKKRKMSQKDKIRRDSEIVSKMSAAPGKLDHASIVAYEVGLFRPDEETMDSIPLEGTFSSESHSSDSQNSKPYHSGAASSSTKSPNSHKKKIRPKKLFSKIRNLSVGSSPQSPTSDVPHEFLPVSPKKFSFKRPRPHQHSAPSTPSSPPGIEGLHSPVFEGFRYPRPSPMSPSPVTSSPFSPSPSTSGLQMPAQHPCRSPPISFESSV